MGFDAPFYFYAYSSVCDVTCCDGSTP